MPPTKRTNLRSRREETAEQLQPKEIAGNFLIQPAKSLINELSSQVTALQIKPDPHIHKQIVKTLRLLEADLDFAPPPRGLRKYVGQRSPFSSEGGGMVASVS
ncbi:hypothetical protein Z517_02011 [Fonsecaea pedrosoi CBS 271.37]|uniref:Uncharacterized protein n=1 Tax=Fonsecaea pedrosoi CBS 271.37 TaxID=1442368 RepID=A0A0D2GP64_9EURO|nr:uncharacterized protein Z517_02011 [Fonsecaea pedrosoi CBS 271.37]KIW82768.1 hypothetical protein Z517_02011 [Fonsecaea pedrosoi CBS 271.37]